MSTGTGSLGLLVVRGTASAESELRGRLARLGRPWRPFGADADAVIDERRAHVQSAWEALLLEGLVPPQWGDGAARFVRGPNSPASAFPSSLRALRALSGDPHGAGRAELCVAQTATACAAWLECAGMAPPDRGAYGPPCWTTETQQSGPGPAIVASNLIPLPFKLLEQTLIDLDLGEYDRISDFLRRAFLSSSRSGWLPLSSIRRTVAASAWHATLASRGERLRGPGPLAGVEVASLPDPFDPLAELYATGYLWPRSHFEKAQRGPTPNLPGTWLWAGERVPTLFAPDPA